MEYREFCDLVVALFLVIAFGVLLLNLHRIAGDALDTAADKIKRWKARRAWEKSRKE